MQKLSRGALGEPAFLTKWRRMALHPWEVCWTYKSTLQRRWEEAAWRPLIANLLGLLTWLHCLMERGLSAGNHICEAITGLTFLNKHIRTYTVLACVLVLICFPLSLAVIAESIFKALIWEVVSRPHGNHFKTYNTHVVKGGFFFFFFFEADKVT